MTPRLIIVSICVLTLGACRHRSDKTNDITTATIDTGLVYELATPHNPSPCDTTRRAQAHIKGFYYYERFKGKDDQEIFNMIQIDSLYLWDEGKVWPQLFSDLYFDKKHSHFWPGLHHPISLRKQVLDSICDCSLLQKILIDSNKILDEVYALPMKAKMQPRSMYDFTVPHSKYSIRELTRMRYKELDCK